MKKRLLALFLCIFMLTGFCSCSGDSNESQSGNTSAEQSADMSGESTDASTEQSTDASADTSEEVSEETSEAPSAGGEYGELSKVDSLLAERATLEKGANSDYKPLNYNKMKAMWISQFDFENIYSNGSKQRSESSYKRLVDQTLDKIVELGFNTVIVQIRPNADSFYPSQYYPWSHFINGSYGKFAKYDPLKIFIDKAHERDLSFQAWINPMRAMAVEDAEKLDPNYPMAKWIKDPNCSRYLYVGTYADRPNYYLNVYYEEVRQLIIDGAAEIVRYYDVDGVHMDDYFYPGDDANMDNLELIEAKKKDATMTLRKLRNESLNKLVSGLYSAVKAENPNVLFGIAPAGNINNVRNSHYADVDTWCGNKGYIDYIMPQIYWGFEHSVCPFAETYQLWADLCCKDVDFMVGLTFANAIYGYEGIYYDEFINNKDIYKKTYEYMNAQPDFEGFSIFCYQYFCDPLTAKPNPKTEEELANATPAMGKIPSNKIEY